MTVTLYDILELDGGFRKTQDGYLVATPKVARTGIQVYSGIQVDSDGSLGLISKAQVRVYRPPEEVFSNDSMKSYAYRPITNDHPSSVVTADNWRELSVGQTGGEVARDGDWVRVPMVLMDSAMIKTVEDGKRELSMGYTCVIEAQDGVTPDGEPYDAIQRQLRMNHLAVVSAARAGPEARIGDETGDKKPIKKEDAMSTKIVVLGDEGVEVVEKDEAKVVAYRNKVAKDMATLQADRDRLEADRDNFKQKYEDAQAASTDMKAMDAAVAARADLLAKVKSISPELKTDGLSNADIRRAAVVGRFGDSMKDKADAYIEARFDGLCEDAASNTQLAHAIGSQPVAVGDAAAYDAALAEVNANFNKRYS